MSNSTLTLIYLIYGLSFLGMSLGITVSLRRTGKIRLLTGFHWLALFGLVHGLHEWVDLVFLLWGPLHPALELLDALALLVSFVFLLQFALGTLLYRVPLKLYQWIPLAAAGIVVFFLAITGDLTPDRIELASRWILGWSGALASGAAMVYLAKKLHDLGLLSRRFGALVATGGFLGYSVAVVLVDSGPGGIPIPLIRTFFAVVISAGVLLMLRAFWVEGREPFAAVDRES